MNSLRLISRSLKAHGLIATVKKIARFMNRQIDYTSQRLPIYFNYWKLRLYVVLLPRIKNRTIRLLGYRIYHHDLKSLYVEFKDIFKNKIYLFTPHNPTKIKIIDGGGFIGLATLFFKYHYPNSSIIIFEPSQEALPYLKRNIEQNKLLHVIIIEKGLSDHDGTISFNASTTDAGKIDPTGTDTITVTKLSHYLTESVDFVKLNIEGAEHGVIQELDNSGKLTSIDQLCLEWHSFSHQNQNLDEILAILKKNNFKYIFNHYDYVSNRAVKPPFNVEAKTQYYLIVFAKKMS